jgi:hypothetical protein
MCQLGSAGRTSEVSIDRRLRTVSEHDISGDIFKPATGGQIGDRHIDDYEAIETLTDFLYRALNGHSATH